MKKKLILHILFLLLMGSVVSAQIPPPLEMLKPYADSMYFYAGLRKLQQYKATYVVESEPTYYQALATFYTFNGLLDSAIIAMDKSTQGELISHEREADTSNLSGYTAVGARQYILNEVGKYRALMIDGAHHVPQHRFFVKSLLQELYSKGFRYLCIDDLKYDPIWFLKSQDLRVPYLANEGYYTREPYFGELIREAARIGYTVRGYTPEEYCSAAERDSLMANNIYRIMGGDNPRAKVLVLSGLEQMEKSAPASLYNNLQKHYGLNALTVSQTEFYEHSSSYYESPYYIAFTRHFQINTPSVLLDSTGALYRLGNDLADISIYSPRVSYTHGKPDWLLEEGARKRIPVKPNRKTVWIKAYHASETTIKKPTPERFFIPVDQLIVDRNMNGGKYHLMLPQGIFLIQYLDEKGKRVKEYYYQNK